MICDLEIELKIGILSDIDKAIEAQYDEGKSQMDQITDNLDANESLDDIEHLKDLASEAPVIRMVNLIFQRALESKASDIHFEPFDDVLIIRLRIDGVLQKIESTCQFDRSGYIQNKTDGQVKYCRASFASGWPD